MASLRAACVACAIAAIRCVGSSRPSRFYTLAPLQVRDRTESIAADATLAVGPIEIPESIDRPQIVTRTGANELRMAEFDRWGGSLSDEISGSLVATLRDRLAARQIAVAPWRSAILSGGSTYRVAVSVSRFDGIAAQSVVLQVRWELIAQASGGVQSSLGVREATLTEPIRGEGYDAVVAAMQKALARLGEQLGDGVIAAMRVARAP